MKFSEIISERSLADVGVRGGKFYLAARGEHIDLENFVHTGQLHGVKGVSSTKYIWADFSPNVGRDIFFVMDAADTLRANRLSRVGYTNSDALIANNSKMLGRILSVNDVSKGPCDNLISGVFSKIENIKSLGGDPISVSNRALFIAHNLQRGTMLRGDDMFKDVDTSGFGDNGLRLNSYEDYANLYYQGAKAAGWYGTPYVKFFAPQNRNTWLPLLKKAIVAQANIYSDESEWVNDGDTLIVPSSTLVLLAIPQKFQDGPPEKKDTDTPFTHMGRWDDYDEKRWEYYQRLLTAFKNGPYKFKIVEAGATANALVKTRTKRLA
jgi:hypothetical protein